MSFIKPTNDLLFKKAFTSVGHEEILLGLIQDFLGITVSNVIVDQPYDIDTYRKEFENKQSQPLAFYTEVDLRATVDSGETIVIEMQIMKHDFFFPRMLYYATGAYRKNYERQGDQVENPYGKLKDTYILSIMDFAAFETDLKGLRRFSLTDMDYSNKSFSDYSETNLHLYFLSLLNSTDLTFNQQQWVNYFKDEPISEAAPAYIHQARGIIDFHNLEKEERNMAEQMTQAEANFYAYISTARREGREEGREEERIRMQREFILNMYREGLSLSQIARVVEIDEDKVQSIIDNMDAE